MIKEQNLPYPLELSYGTAYFNPELDEDIHDVIKRSDKLMYKMKQMMERGKDEYKRRTMENKIGADQK
jgi:GGDEF domain-containing protein